MMRMRRMPMKFRSAVRSVLVLSLALVLHGCGVNEVEIPELTGPSERAESLVLRATPDVLVADGRSFAIIRGTFLDRNGQPLPGRGIHFATADESGRFASIGSLSNDTVATDVNGIAQVLYTTPPRTDATANQFVKIMARPIGDDASGDIYRSVTIELRSAEPRLFPQNPDNELPSCNFVVEAPSGYRTNTAILFQSTANDVGGTIVRYEWDFGDNTREDKPDTAKVYRSAGTFKVIHTVTDDDGGQAACFVDLTIT
jgi:hypothetical protein